MYEIHKDNDCLAYLAPWLFQTASTINCTLAIFQISVISNLLMVQIKIVVVVVVDY